MSEAETNLRVLRPSRTRPREGDLFAMQLVDGRFLFGRVIDADATSGTRLRGAILIYVYRLMSGSIDPPDREELSPKSLLIPPLMTNRLPWSRGYFETIAHWPLQSHEVLDQHCFLSVVNGRYFDEKGNELLAVVEPCGDYGLNSYRTIGEGIREAVGPD
jgi:hypothetical protein